MTPNEALPVYMHPIELSQLLAILHTLSPKHILEWGAGGSTRVLLEQGSSVERHVSIEHDRAWADKVRSIVTDPRLSLVHIPPDKPLNIASPTQKQIEAWDASAEIDLSVLAAYVAYPKTLGIRFDFILVDGRARCFCLREGFELLRPGGVIVLHDAQRTQYHDALRSLGKPVFLEPWQQGQIAFVRKPD